jgi:hypothetical protein
MSQVATNPNDGLGITERKFIEGIIGEKWISDYAIVQQVNGDDTVDVVHAIRSQLLDGRTLPPTITKNVEVMSLASQAFRISFPIQTGDKVLLIGLRNYVPALSGVAAPQEPSAFLHYQQNTMKAIPLGILASSGVQIIVDESGNLKIQATAGLIQIKNTAQSLYTLLNTLETALSTFMGSAAQSAITTAGASPVPAPLAAAIVALMATFSTATATMLADLAQLLEA